MVILYLLGIYIKLINSYVILPLEMDNNRLKESINEYSGVNKTIEKLENNNILVELQIGTPPQKINVPLNIDDYHFYIISKSTIKAENISKYNIFNKNLSQTFHYQKNKENSIVYEQTEVLEFGEDDIYFNIKNNIKKINNFKIYIAKKITLKTLGCIGLQMNIKYDDNFLYKLKDIYKLINEYIWYIDYTDKNNKGKLYIGVYPHEINNKKYLKENLKLIYSNNNINDNKFNLKKTKYQWGLHFYNIFTLNKLDLIKNCKYCNNAILSYNCGVIIGINLYKNYIKKYLFDKYIQNNDCFENTIYLDNTHTQDLNHIFNTFYCNVKLENDLKKNFIPLIFQHNEFNYNFTLEYNDLFEVIDNYIYFKILFGYYSTSNYWVLGKPFLLKYNFIFNSDSNQIGFYTPLNNYLKNYNDLENKKNISSKVNIILLKILIAVFLLLFGIYIGKKLFGFKRRLHANELEDQFEYNPTLLP